MGCEASPHKMTHVAVWIYLILLSLCLSPLDVTDGRKEEIYRNKWDTIYGKLQGGTKW